MVIFQKFSKKPLMHCFKTNFGNLKSTRKSKSGFDKQKKINFET